MRLECRERFPCHLLQRKPRVSDPSMNYGTCVTHVPWCMSGSLTRGGGEYIPGIPGAWANTQFYVSGKGLMQTKVCSSWLHRLCFAQFCLTRLNDSVLPSTRIGRIVQWMYDNWHSWSLSPLLIFEMPQCFTKSPQLVWITLSCSSPKTNSTA